MKGYPSLPFSAYSVLDRLLEKPSLKLSEIIDTVFVLYEDIGFFNIELNPEIRRDTLFILVRTQGLPFIDTTNVDGFKLQKLWFKHYFAMKFGVFKRKKLIKTMEFFRAIGVIKDFSYQFVRIRERGRRYRLEVKVERVQGGGNLNIIGDRKKIEFIGYLQFINFFHIGELLSFKFFPLETLYSFSAKFPLLIPLFSCMEFNISEEKRAEFKYFFYPYLIGLGISQRMGKISPIISFRAYPYFDLRLKPKEVIASVRLKVKRLESNYEIGFSKYNASWFVAKDLEIRRVKGNWVEVFGFKLWILKKFFLFWNFYQVDFSKWYGEGIGLEGEGFRFLLGYKEGELKIGVFLLPFERFGNSLQIL